MSERPSQPPPPLLASPAREAAPTAESSSPPREPETEMRTRAIPSSTGRDDGGTRATGSATRDAEPGVGDDSGGGSARTTAARAPENARASQAESRRPEADAPLPFADAPLPSADAPPASAPVAFEADAQADAPAGRTRRRSVAVVGESVRPRVEKLRDASIGVFEEASEDTGLRFVLIAIALFLISLFFILLHNFLG